jgi:hypothetical protein
MNSDYYKNLIKDSKNPENQYPEYNIVNHNKIEFVKRAKNMFPDYSHYGWIDFGCWRNSNDRLTDFNWAELQDEKIHFSSYNYCPNDIENPIEICKSGKVMVHGSMFIMDKKCVDWYSNEYTETLLYLQSLNIVDDDQSIVVQIYKKYPEKFNLHINTECFKLLHYFECSRLIDIIIPVAEKDIELLKECIIRAKKHIKNSRNVYIISAPSIKNYIPNDTIFVDENNFGFSKKDIEQILAENNITNEKKRIGWLFQQLLKFYAYKVIKNLCNQFVIVDSETLFYNDIDYFNNQGMGKYALSNEITQSYIVHQKKLLTDTTWNPNISGIVHCMLFEKNVLNEIFDRARQKYFQQTGQNLPFWKVMLNLLDNDNVEYSEYDIYFNYVMQHRSYHCIPENSLWDISPVVEQSSKCIWLTCHHHIRNLHWIEKYQFRIGNKPQTAAPQPPPPQPLQKTVVTVTKNLRPRYQQPILINSNVNPILHTQSQTKYQPNTRPQPFMQPLKQSSSKQNIAPKPKTQQLSLFTPKKK